MTVEEIDIIVQASTEQAIKEFQKILPTIKKQLSGIQKEFDKVNIKNITANINMSHVTKKVKQVKEQIKDVFNPSDIRGMTIDGRAFKIENIKSYSKEVQKLKGQIGTLNRFKVNTSQVETPKITKIKPQVANIDTGQVNQYSIWINMLKKYYAMLDVVKVKMYQLRQETEKTGTSQNKWAGFFSGFKRKIEQVKQSISGIKDSFNKMPKITQKITNNIKDMGSGLKQGLRHILKYAIALFSLRGIYSILSNSAQSWLSSQNNGARQLSANIEYMKYAMGSALAPVIQFITNLVYQLMRAIQSVAFALTGVNIFAKATASSMNKAAGSAKQASKSLAGVHNEINNVSQNKNDGGGSVNPSFDLSKIDMKKSIIDVIKDGDWSVIGETVGKKINSAMESIPWDRIQNTARKIGRNIAGFLNGVIKETDWNQMGNTFAQGLNTIIYFGYEFVSTFDWKQFGKAIGDSINGFFQNIDWETAGKTLGESIKGIFTTIFTTLEEIDWQELARNLEDFIMNIDWGGVAQTLFRVLGSALGGLTAFIGTLIADAFIGIGDYFNEKIDECGGDIVAGILKGILDAIVGIGQWITDNIFKPFLEGFKNAFGIHSPSKVMEEQGNYIIDGLFNGLSGIWESVCGIFINLKEKILEKFNEIKDNIVNWILTVKEKWKEFWESIFLKASEISEKIKSTISEWINKIKEKIYKSLNTIKNKWNEIWTSLKTTVSNIFSGIWKVIKGSINNILGGIEKMANGVVNGVNTVIRALNTLHFDMPDWLGGGSFGFNIPTMRNVTLPKLRNGNVAKKTTLGIFGEYANAQSNPEITSPKNVMYDTMKEAIRDSDIGSNSNSEVQHLTLQVGAEKLFDDVIDYINEKTRRIGKCVIKVGG